MYSPCSADGEADDDNASWAEDTEASDEAEEESSKATDEAAAEDVLSETLEKL